MARQVDCAQDTQSSATAALRTALGAGARWREGQWEAIRSVVEDRARLLLVQRTGWGKSLVYLLAMRLLRDRGAGPALLISPLLSLMRNQMLLAKRLGVTAATIHSANKDAWREVEEALWRDEVDILLISPERLGDVGFVGDILPLLRGGIGLLVVDEVHCISDWGHDFRPDYRRIVGIVRELAPGVPVVATTATANDRVVQDVVEQLGAGLQVMRGGLARESLRLQTIDLPGQAERLAWLAANLPSLPGTGIVYCLTVHDAERVAKWLAARRIDAPAYHARLDPEQREELERRLLANEVKALVATVALGMGFDKPDLGFVVHYQRPGSPVAYYQQIGRAGRALPEAAAVLLHGAEDDHIEDYFIRTALPEPGTLTKVLAAVEELGPVGLPDLLARLNLRHGEVDRALRLLLVDGAVSRDRDGYQRTSRPWHDDLARREHVAERRRFELGRMRDFTATGECLMAFIQRELDDPTAAACGRCANCAGPLLRTALPSRLVRGAADFLRGDAQVIVPQRRWPAGLPRHTGRLDEEQWVEEGRALCVYDDGGWGHLVAQGKYRDGRFSDELVKAAAHLVRRAWRPLPPPTWVAWVPSLRRPTLVADWAARLARALRLPPRAALRKVIETPQQKDMANSVQQVGNILPAFQADPAEVLPGPVLLVDDLVDSGWTLTICGLRLREAGCCVVYPFALAQAAGTGSDR